MTDSASHDPSAARVLAYSAVAGVWLFALAVGIRIGLDLGRAIF